MPIGTGLAAMMAARIASMLPPVERSITVSAPRSTAVFSLSSSLSTSEVTAELPMLALILHLALMPMPIGSSPSGRWAVLAGITIRPRATSARTSSGSRFSRRATYSISAVIIPRRACSICVMVRATSSACRSSARWPGASDGAGPGVSPGFNPRRHPLLRSIHRPAPEVGTARPDGAPPARDVIIDTFGPTIMTIIHTLAFDFFDGAG